MDSKMIVAKAATPTSNFLIQSLLIVWLDQNIDENSPQTKDSIEELESVVDTVQTFSTVDPCIAFISSIKNEKIFLISSGTLGQKAVPHLHDNAQVSAIYIFCGNKNAHEEWAKNYSKIKGVFTAMKHVCEALERTIGQCNRNRISIGFVSTNNDTMNKSLDQFDQSFVYGQVLKEILLSITFESKHRNAFIVYCREQVVRNKRESDNIAILEKDSQRQNAISLYTQSRFLSSMLNQALNTFEIDVVMKLGFFIRELHEQITQLHTTQSIAPAHSNSFVAYRGESLPVADFEHLQKTLGGLLSFTNFLSASRKRHISLDLARQAMEITDLVGVIFVLNINPSEFSTPFADISAINSDVTEDDILFSMHSVFRINEIKNIDENNRLWEVKLSLISHKDPQLHSLTELIREETYPRARGWSRLGDLLTKLNQFEKAQQVFERILTQHYDKEEAGIYHKLGMIKEKQGEYVEAISFYKDSLKINQRILPPTHSNLCGSYICLGQMYETIGDYSKAMASLEKALDIHQKTLPPNHPDLAASYRNIGNVYYKLDKYPEALQFQEKAHEIYQKTLPSHHPDLAAIFYSIGTTHYKMNDYSKAISYLEQAVNIGQASLSVDDPHLQQWQKDLDNAKKQT